MRKLRTKSGFTLAEMIVAMGIFALVSIALGAMITQSIKGWSSGTSQANADSAASLVIHKLWQDVRVGSSAEVTSGELNVTVPTLITDASGETYYDTTTAGTVYRYYLSSGILYRQIGSATATVYARSIKEITFTAGGDTVGVSVTSEDQVGTSSSSEECTTQIVLRNFTSS